VREQFGLIENGDRVVLDPDGNITYLFDLAYWFSLRRLLPMKRQAVERSKPCEDGSLSCGWAKFSAAVRDAFAS
jgi:hypothetical protein